MELNEKYKQGIDCTIVILSYNTKDVTFECLKRVEISRQYFSRKLQKKADIVVVENGSKDGSLEMIKENYPEVKLIALEKNVGYPRGNNLAMEKVTSPYILLINSDTYLKEETLAQAYEYMEENLACDVLSARLVYLDGSFQAFSGFLPTPFRSIRWSFLIESIPVINKLIKPLYQYDKSFYKEEKQFDWVTTGFFFMRKKVYEVTGGFP